MNSPKLPNSDRLIGIAAFLISVCTFFVYIYEARLLQKQQYASALPYLEMWNSRPRKGSYKLELINGGVGPAFLKEIRVHYKGKVYEGDHVRFYYKVVPRAERLPFTSSGDLRHGRVIQAGQSIDLILVDSSTAAANHMYKLFGEGLANIEIVYSSVYDESWRIVGMMDPPQKLDD